MRGGTADVRKITPTADLYLDEPYLSHRMARPTVQR